MRMTASGVDPVREEYTRLADHYDRRWAKYNGATTRETIRRMAARPGDRILDVGCGTGELLRVLSERVPGLKLTGLDPCQAMLDMARRKLPGEAALLEASADRLPLTGGVFDIAISISAFHYFRKPLDALREFRRVLNVGGRLIITDWCHDYLSCRLCDSVLRKFNRAHFRTYRASDCHSLLEQAGFGEVKVERYRINWLWGLMTACGTKTSA